MKFLNRDQSWLSFNARCLDETDKDAVPLGEKGLFFGITMSNLEEFMQVRYPIEVKESSEKDLKVFKDRIADFYQMFNFRWTKFNKKYRIVRPVKDLKDDPEKWVQKTFKSEVFPVLQPMTIDKRKNLYLHPGVYLFVYTKKPGSDNETINYIEIPKGLDRYIAVPGKKYCVDVIDLIQNNLKFMFKDRKISTSFPVSILRSAEVYDMVDRDLDPFEQIRATLKERDKSWITILEIGTMDKIRIKQVKNLLPLGSHTIIFCSKDVHMSALKSLPGEIFSEKEQIRSFKHYKTFPETDIFEYIRKQDRLAFYPYESYTGSMIKFLEDASVDKNVLSIKISLYRVANNSRIVNALLKAADNGKAVTVLIELKARFDEHHNMEIASILREGGVRVAFTNPDIKTHAKICIITRKEKKGLKTYCQIGTGNYSESNAKQYTDYAYFTCNDNIGYDVTRFFDLMTSDQGPFKSREVIYSPYNMRDMFTEEIKKEVKKAKAGKQAEIFIKCNSMADEDIAEKLVSAAKAGVKITMLIRGACIMEPQKNIKIYSILDHYLEHSRIYRFGSGKDARVYIGSADIMGRNLNKRYELLILVDDPEIRARLMNHIHIYLSDNTNMRIIQEKYKYSNPKKSNKPFNAQAEFQKEAKKLSLD